MRQFDLTNLKLWKSVSFVALLFLIIFTVRLSFADIETIVQYMPDDGFYYLTMARNFSDLGQWSFDSGNSLTTGFHPIWAYLLTGIYSVFQPSSLGFVQFGLWLSVLFGLGSGGLIWRFLVKSQNTLGLILFTLLVSSVSFTQNAISATEWSLGLVLLCVYSQLIYKNFGDMDKKLIVQVFLVGMLTSLVRTDSGLWAFGLFAVSLIMFWKTSREKIWLPLAGLVGAASGVGLVFLHNYVFTGSFLQSSALIKAYWTKFAENTEYEVAYLFLNTLGISGQGISFQRVGLVVLMLALVVLLLTRFGKFQAVDLTEVEDRSKVFVGAGVVALLGYAVFYFLNGAIQQWYSINFILPVYILAYAIFWYLDRLIPRRSLALLGGFVLIVSLYNVVFINTIDADHSPHPHQRYFAQAGMYLNTFEHQGRLGSWNAGIIGYFQGGEVINLDGLVNNDVYPYIIENRLPEYIEQVGIEYLIDVESWFSVEKVKQGGYDDENFLSGLNLIRSFGNSEIPWENVVILEVNP